MVRGKIDIHLHSSLEEVPPNKQFVISSAEKMLPHLERLGIERAILMSSGEGTPLGNQECQEICEKFPRQYGWMCNVNMEESELWYDKLQAYKEAGAIGVGELVINKRLDDPLFYPLFEACEQLELPILFHMSPEEGFSYGVVDEPGLPLLEKAMQQYPKLRWIGHSQPFWQEISQDAPVDREARNQWGEGTVIEGGRLIQLLNRYPNLYCDLSANSGGCAIMRDEAFGLAFLDKFQDRLLFGTDMVNDTMIFPLGAWLEAQRNIGHLSETAYQKITRENAIQLFQLK